MQKQTKLDIDSPKLPQELYDYLREKHPQVPAHIEEEDLFVAADAENGLQLILAQVSNMYFITAGNWHTELHSEDQAGHLLLACLTPYIRVREARRGGFAYRWYLEYNWNGKWSIFEEFGSLLYPVWACWKKREEHIFSNNYLSSSDYVQAFLETLQ